MVKICKTPSLGIRDFPFPSFFLIWLLFQVQEVSNILTELVNLDLGYGSINAVVA